MNILWVKQLLPMQAFKIVCGVLLGVLAMQAVAKPAKSSARDKTILLMPTANPSALPANRGKATVRFSVQMVGKNKLPAPVLLRRLDDKKTIAMNDLGKDGDLVARDGIYGVYVQIDTSKVKADSCLNYEALTRQKRGSLKSPSLKLCVSSFPIGIAPVNISNPARWGEDTRAAADEVLITVAPAVNATAVRELARSINAKVAGSILPLNFYQLRLPAPASPDQLQSKVQKLRASPGVTSASVNLLGQGALNVNDAAFDLPPSNVNSQHGLKLVLGHNPPSDGNAANAWDGNNRGAGVKVVVMDTGLDLTHPDLPDTWTCQLIPAPPALMNPTVLETPCTSSIVSTTVARHGTLVAGVIAASASIGGAEGAGEGIAGVAFNSTIHSMKMTGFDLANQTHGFHQAAVYRGEHADALVYNASFNVLNAFAPVADVTALCGAINSLVLSGSTARAIVVNSAGNNNSNGRSWPGRCNDPHTGGSAGTDALSALGKPLLITVANSVSFLTNKCGNGAGAQAGIDQLCRADIVGGTTHLGSNYGAWVDIAAPGSEIRSTTIVGTGDGGGNYVSETGTTMAAPFVSGAAAILLSCGVPLSGVENALKTSANVVSFPDGSSAKRLDIKLATASCNQPPETNAGSGSGLEDAVSIAVTLSGSDVDGSVASFQITSLPANGVLFSDAGLTTAIPMGGTVSAAANTATVYFVPDHNFNGSTSLNYASLDNLGMVDATPAIAPITVTAVNDPPSFTKGADQTVPEDGGAQLVPGWATGINAGPADEAAQTLTFNITGNTNPALFSAAPAISPTGILTYTPAANARGSTTITVELTDNGGGANTSAPQTFVITVAPVNDVPSFVAGANQSVQEDAGAQTVAGWASSISAGPADEAAQTLSFNITGNTNTALFSTQPAISPTGTLTYVPADNANGSATITVVLTDSGGGSDTSAPRTFVITVSPMNDAPSFVAGANQSVQEDAGAQTVPGWASSISAGPADEAAQTLSFNITGNTNTALFSTQPATSPTGTLTYVPADNANGSATITVELTDNGGGANTSAPQMFTINVTPVNDAPSGSDGTVSTDEDTTYHFTATDFGFSDALDSPPNGLSAIQITAVPSTGALELGGATVTINQTIPIAGLGNLTFAPVGEANGAPYASFTFKVVDDGGNNAANGDINTAPTPNTLTINVNPVEDLLSGLPVIAPAVSPATRTIGTELTAVTDGSMGTPALSDADCPPPPLTAPPTSGGIGTSAPCVLAYQWKRSSDPSVSGVPISGATNQKYTLSHIDATNTDLNKFMSLCVSTGSGAGQCTVNETTAVGDPHITTVDGLHYDFQGAGEFVALRGAGGMEIQLRMAAVSTAPPLPDPYTGLTSGVSVNTAVAARVGQHRVTYQPDTGPNAGGAFVLRVDGNVVTTTPAEGVDLGDGGRVLLLPQAGGIQIDFPDQTTLMVNTSPWPFYGAHWLHVSVFHTPAYEGIMGARSKGSWLPRLSNGSALGVKPASLHDRYVDLYVKFADSWRVNKDTSLFDYAAGTSTATFTNKAWPTENGPYATGTGSVAQPLPRQAAELACRDIVGKIEKADCVFDVRVMGHKALAKGHLLNQQIRLGAVNVIVRPADKLNARGELVVTATVARHATVVPRVQGIRAVPAGTVQFMLGDKPLGKPVRLDAKGQAKLVMTRQNLERFNVGKQAISARYLPAKVKGNVFLPSTSLKKFSFVKPGDVVVKPIIRPDLPGQIKRGLPLK